MKIKIVSIFLICFILLIVERVNCAKCVFSFGSGLSICENVNSMNEILREIRPTWIKLKISGRLDIVFAIEGNYGNNNLFLAF